MKTRLFVVPILIAAAFATSSLAEDALRLDSSPVLQNPAGNGMTVVWAVTRRATGWVEYGETEALGKTAERVVFGRRQIADRVLSVRMEGLEPGTTYFYRVAAALIDYNDNLTIRRGPAVFGEVFSFTTPSEKRSEASFAVLNDTHAHKEAVPRLLAALAKEPADFTVWNGDLGLDRPGEGMDWLVEQALRPAGTAYAARKPVLFVSGNHDVRGPMAFAVPQVFTPWDAGPMGRCFVVRQGPLAIVGLDTGEDKDDAHPYYGGLSDFDRYRAAQREWLEQAVQREEFRTAPHKVAVCHIPLHGAWSCAQSRKLWSDVLARAGVQLVISGHDHKHRHDPPAADRSFAQLVGGGPAPQEATLIRAHATAERLSVRMLDIEGKQLGAWEYPPSVAKP